MAGSGDWAPRGRKDADRRRSQRVESADAADVALDKERHVDPDVGGNEAFCRKKVVESREVLDHRNGKVLDLSPSRHAEDAGRTLISWAA